MKIRSYRCPKCGREYNFADGGKTRLCRACGCELDSLTVYSTDGESAEKDQASATRRENREAEEQEALFVWAEYQSAAHPELRLLYHIPNEGKRSVAYGAALRRQGMKKGVPDLCLPVARGKYHGLYIEMKAGRNKPTVDQQWWLEALERQGFCAVWCSGWERAKEEISEYLILKEIEKS